MSTYSEILARFKKDIKNTFQAQKNIVDITQKYLAELEDAEGGSSAGGVNYSTNEQNTGIKWTDGKDIYCKTFTNVSCPMNSYTTSLDLGVEADTVVKIEGNNQAIVNPTTEIVFNAYYAKVNKVSGSNTILNPTNQLASLTNVTLTIYYTKA